MAETLSQRDSDEDSPMQPDAWPGRSRSSLPTTPERCMAAQGLNRVQQAPSVSRAMHAVLHRCQQRLGTWVGSSVVHLGDHNVPNALMFIDKYTQVSSLPDLCLSSACPAAIIFPPTLC